MRIICVLLAVLALHTTPVGAVTPLACEPLLLNWTANEAGPYLAADVAITPPELPPRLAEFDPAIFTAEVRRILVPNWRVVTMLSPEEAKGTDWNQQMDDLVRFTGKLLSSFKNIKTVPLSYRRQLSGTLLHTAINYFNLNKIKFAMKSRRAEEDGQYVSYLQLLPNLEGTKTPNMATRFKRDHPDWTLEFDPFLIVDKQIGAQVEPNTKVFNLAATMITIGTMKAPLGLHESRHLALYEGLEVDEDNLFAGLSMTDGENQLKADYENPISGYNQTVGHDEPRAMIDGILQYMRDLHSALGAGDEADIALIIRRLRYENWFGLITSSTLKNVLASAKNTLESDRDLKFWDTNWHGHTFFGINHLSDKKLLTGFFAVGDDARVTDLAGRKKIFTRKVLDLEKAALALLATHEFANRVTMMIYRQPDLHLKELMRHAMYLTVVHATRRLDRGHPIGDLRTHYNTLIQQGARP